MTLSFRKMAPRATPADRKVLAIGLRELRRAGLMLPAKTRHEIKSLIRSRSGEAAREQGDPAQAPPRPEGGQPARTQK